MTLSRLGRLALYACGILVAAFAVLVVLALVKQRVDGDVVTVVSAMPPQPSAPPDVVEPISVTVSTAAFRDDDVLDECVDWTFTATAAQEANRAADAFRKRISSPDKNSIASVLTQRPCSDQFAERIELATCAFRMSPEKTPGHVVAGVSHYYNVKTAFEDTSYSKQCLEIGGDWRAAPRGNNRVERERLRQQVNNAIKDTQ